MHTRGKLWLLFLLPIFVIGFCCVEKIYEKSEKYIDDILNNKYYDYLPAEAKKYVKDVYEETGEIILTEKNKEPGALYLNPVYVEYLASDDKGDGYIPDPYIQDYEYHYVSASTLPNKYDLRNVNGKNYTTSLKDQAEEGLCWDFAMTAAFESKLMKKGLANPGSDPDYSERHMDYAVSNPSQAIDIGLNPWGSSHALGDGGSDQTYILGASRGIAPIKESDFNHAYNTTEKLMPEEVYNKEISPYTIDGTQTFYQTDSFASSDLVSLVKQAVYDNGAVSVSVPGSSTEGCMVTYTPTGSESLLYPGGSYSVNGLIYKPTNSSCNINHAEAVIGWDDTYRHGVCISSANKISNATYNSSTGTYSCSSGTLKTISGAWIVKNSWGNYTQWSYSYLAYDSYGSSYTTITDINSNNTDNMYISSSNNKEITYTKPAGKEKLRKIKFGTSVNDISVDVYVSADGDASNYVKQKTVSMPYRGLYTVDLSSSNIYLTGTSFKIKLVTNSSISLPYSITAYTDNSTSNVYIKMKNAEYNPNADYSYLKNKNIVSQDYIIVLDGISRNLLSNNVLTFKVKNSSGTDVTSKFTFYRRYAVSNVINTIVGFNNNVNKGTYDVEVYYGGTRYDTFKMVIDGSNFNCAGSGTSSSPYLIDSPGGLSCINKKLSGYYKLMSDLDLSYDTTNSSGLYYNSGNGFTPIGTTSYPFSGTLDGNGHTITGLYSKCSSTSPCGLFGIAINASITNLTMKNVTINGGYSGAVVGKYYNKDNSTGTLNFTKVASIGGTITSSKEGGGIVGSAYLYKNNINFNNLYSDSTITSSTAAGGIIGVLYSSGTSNTTNLVLNNLQTYANITGTRTSGGLIGAISGASNYTVKINNSMSLSTLSSSSSVSKQHSFCFDTGMYSNSSKVVLTNFYGTSSNLYQSGSNVTVNNCKNYNIMSLAADATLYNSWTNFSDNYQKPDRSIPVLKFVDFNYTNDIGTINLNVGESKNLLTLLNIQQGNFNYSNSNSSVAIVTSGVIKGLQNGATNLTVTNAYDGYERRIRVNVGTIYSVSFNANGGTGSMDTISNAANTSMILPANTFTRAGYAFEKWNTKADGTGTSYNNRQTVSLTSNLTLYAQWKKVSYTVTFNANYGSSPATSTQTISASTPTLLRANQFERTGYIFSKWNTSANGTGTDYEDEASVTLTGNLTLYAQWVEAAMYTVRDYSNDTTKNYIDLISPKTTPDTYKSKFTLQQNYSMAVESTDKDDYVYTNSKTRISKNGLVVLTLTNIVRGDINGDGKVNSMDYVKIINHIMEKAVLTDEISKMAADFDKNNKISSMDYIKVKNYIMGKGA